jgi:uncharacterized membrane protein YfcA
MISQSHGRSSPACRGEAHVTILLPVAGISVNILALVGAGALVGFLSGMLGVGGGFLLTPTLIMLGVPPTVAAASDTNAIVATSSSGMAAHFRMGNVDLKLGSVLLVGGLTGSAIGVHIIKAFRRLGNADVLISLTYVIVLGTIGSYMFAESLRSLRRGALAPHPGAPRHRSKRLLGRLPFQMRFPQSGIEHSVFVPFVLCMVVGVLAAVMGVGGGFIMVPMMVYLLRMPMHVAVGTDLFQILFTCAGVTLMQAATNYTVDIVLALLVAFGSTVGAQAGARMSKVLRGEQLKIVLASVVLLTTLKMTIGLFPRPALLLSSALGN